MILILENLCLSAQVDKIDTLLLKINNDQLYGTCHYVWVVEMRSSAGDSLIKIGDSAIDRRISLLDNKEKGIIAHIILVKITGIPYSLSSSFEHGIITYYFGGLTFKERDEHFYTSDSILLNNKKKWIKGNYNDPLYINYDSILIKKD